MMFYFYQKILVISVWQESKNKEIRVNNCIFAAVVINVFEEINKWKPIKMYNQLIKTSKILDFCKNNVTFFISYKAISEAL